MKILVVQSTFALSVQPDRTNHVWTDFSDQTDVNFRWILKYTGLLVWPAKSVHYLIPYFVVEHLERQLLIQNTDSDGHSCLTNLLIFLDKVTRLMDGGIDVDAIYLDLAMAFDKVPNQSLLVKLQNHGISGKLMAWVSSWIHGRLQRVGVRGSFSSWLSVISNFPLISNFPQSDVARTNLARPRPRLGVPRLRPEVSSPRPRLEDPRLRPRQRVAETGLRPRKRPSLWTCYRYILINKNV